MMRCVVEIWYRLVVTYFCAWHTILCSEFLWHTIMWVGSNVGDLVNFCVRATSSSFSSITQIFYCKVQASIYPVKQICLRFSIFFSCSFSKLITFTSCVKSPRSFLAKSSHSLVYTVCLPFLISIEQTKMLSWQFFK